MLIAISKLPIVWKIVQMAPVYSKGNKLYAANYWPILVVIPYAILYAAYLHLEMATQSSDYNWRADRQVGFRPQHYLEDLVLVVYNLINYTHIKNLLLLP